MLDMQDKERGKDAVSIKQMAKVWEHSFTPNHQIVMLAMADHANDQGESIFPAIARIAWKTGYSERNVQRIISELRDNGVLKIIRKSTPIRPNEYGIDWSKAKEKPAYTGGRQVDTPIAKRSVGDDSPVTPGVTPTSPKPSVNHQLKALEELECHFRDISKVPMLDWNGNAKMMQKRWRTPTKRMYSITEKDFDLTKELITKSIRQMRNDKLTISAPQSIEKVFTDIYAVSMSEPEGLPNAAALRERS